MGGSRVARQASGLDNDWCGVGIHRSHCKILGDFTGLLKLAVPSGRFKYGRHGGPPTYVTQVSLIGWTCQHTHQPKQVHHSRRCLGTHPGIKHVLVESCGSMTPVNQTLVANRSLQLNTHPWAGFGGWQTSVLMVLPFICSRGRDEIVIDYVRTSKLQRAFFKQRTIDSLASRLAAAKFRAWVLAGNSHAPHLSGFGRHTHPQQACCVLPAAHRALELQVLLHLL